MPIRLTHILDQDAHEDDVSQLTLLLQHMPSDGVKQRVIVIGQAPRALHVPDDVEVTKIARRLNWLMTSGPDLKRTLVRHRPDIVHAWGANAATVIGLSWVDQTPMVITVSVPAEARLSRRWWPVEGAGDGRVVVVCPSKIVQIRLVEAGVPLSATKIIEPGVDSSAIKQAKKTIKRADLGLPEKGRVMLTIPPPTRTGGRRTPSPGTS